MKDCVSLEVAQKLQKAGYKSECVYKHKLFCEETKRVLEFPAPTATQLAEELPEKLIKDDREYGFRIKPHAGKWQVKYVTRSEKSATLAKGGYHSLQMFANQKTLPDALGLMMVYLLENKII